MVTTKITLQNFSILGFLTVTTMTIIISATRRDDNKVKVKEDQAKIYKGYGIDPADGEGNNKKTFDFAAVGDFGCSKNAKKTELDNGNPHTTLTGTFFDNKGNGIRDHFTTTKEIK